MEQQRAAKQKQMFKFQAEPEVDLEKHQSELKKKLLDQ